MRRRIIGAGSIVLLLTAAALVVTAEPTVVGAEKCGKMCHRVQYTSWLETGHAKALEAARSSTEWPFSEACLRCHATNNDEALSGVQCEACHGLGSEFKSIQVMKDRDKAVAAGLVVPTQETCNGCHDGQEHHKQVTFTRDVHAHKN